MAGTVICLRQVRRSSGVVGHHRMLQGGLTYSSLMERATPDRRVWRPKLGSMAGLTILVLLLAGLCFTALPTAAENGLGDVVGVTALFLFPAVVTGAFALRCRIVVDGEGLSIRNLFRDRTFELRGVTGCLRGYWGLRVTFGDGTTALAMAAQKSNAAGLMDAETRSDRIVAEILALRVRDRTCRPLRPRAFWDGRSGQVPGTVLGVRRWAATFPS